MAKNGVPNVKRQRKATKALLKALELYPTMQAKSVSSGTLKTYGYYLNNYVYYCEEIKRDSVLMLTEKGLNEYETFLHSKGQSSKNIRNFLMIVKLLINNVIVKHPVFQTYGVKL